jgi:hypothetical protein
MNFRIEDLRLNVPVLHDEFAMPALVESPIRKSTMPDAQAVRRST